MITVGGQFYYAAGDDEDVQYTFLGNAFNGWDPIFDVGTQLSNEQIDLGDNLVCDAGFPCGGVFDFSGANAGVVGGRLYTSIKAGPGTLGASFAYLTTEEDDNMDADGMFYAAGYVYPVMENTTLQLQIQYTDMDVDSILDLDDTDTDWSALFLERLRNTLKARCLVQRAFLLRWDAMMKCIYSEKR